jgi:hypothetical protein
LHGHTNLLINLDQGLCESIDLEKVSTLNVATSTLGLRPRQGLANVQAKNEACESHFMLMGMQESVKE